MSNKDVAKVLEDLSPIEIYKFASYVPGRTNGSGWNGGGDFKRHPTLSSARVSITLSSDNMRRKGENSTSCKLYEWIGDVYTGRWMERVDD